MSLTVFGSYILFPITISTYLTILQTSVPSDKIGRVMSIDHTISMAIAPIGALIVGPMAELIGIRELFLISSTMGLIYPLIIWFFTRIRELDPIKQKETTKVLEIQEIENKARSVA
jgi:DHA3 family macrolide efflux protein-like MFS transporter